MTDYLAVAQLGPSGNASIQWCDHRGTELPPTTLTVIELGEQLRDNAPYRPDGVVRALVRDMGERGSHQPDAFTLITADRTGSLVFTPADPATWASALAQVAASPARVAPATPGLDHAEPPPQPTWAATPGPDHAEPPPQPTWAAAPESSVLPAPPEAQQSTSEPPPISAPPPPPGYAVSSPASFSTSSALPKFDVSPTPRRGGLTALLGSLGASPVAPKRILGLPSDLTVAVINTKGGAGKTTISILVAAAAAHLAGHHDIALADLNPSGNLARHTNRAVDTDILNLAQAIQQNQVGDSQRDLDPWISWQPGGWVTIMAPTGTRDHHGQAHRPLSETDIDQLVDVLHRTCRLLVLDTGNNAQDNAWQAAIKYSHPILIPVQWDPDTLNRAQEMLIDLEASGHASLHERVIFVGTHSPWYRIDKKRKQAAISTLENTGWKVVEIQADRHIAEQQVIDWEALAPRTRKSATELVEQIIQMGRPGYINQNS